LERDVGSGRDPQVSYKGGEQVRYGPPGSVQLDFVSQDVGASFEVKNCCIQSNSSGLINNIAKQVVQRAVDLPSGMPQQVVIDMRGQTVTPGQRSTVVQGALQKSSGIIGQIDIQFKAK
jgi:filamentous hemagglutinin